MARPKQAPRGMSRTPSQLYVVAKILKDKRLIRDYFHKGPPCSRGHVYRRDDEQWCLSCALSILSGNCGISSEFIHHKYYNAYSDWQAIVDKTSQDFCWKKSIRPTATTISSPTYKSLDPSNYRSVPVDKVSYQWYWGDIGSLSVHRTCDLPEDIDGLPSRKNKPVCVNPLHLRSVFNYPFQEVNPSLDLNFRPDTVIDYIGDEKEKCLAPLHRFLRCQLNTEYRKEQLHVATSCLWGHSVRHKEDGWCYRCVQNILSSDAGFDINYTTNDDWYAIKAYFSGLTPSSNDPFDCWTLPESMRKKIYRMKGAKGLAHDRETSYSFIKMMYTLFWGDIGSIRVKRTCKDPWCWNPRHIISPFNDPSDPPKDIEYVNFKEDRMTYEKINSLKSEYANRKMYMRLPWHSPSDLDKISVFGDTSSFSEAVLSANRT
jgi:hypothetical protein